MDWLKRAVAETIKAAGQGYFPCLFHTLTGAYCPGCGGTRALIALLSGKLLLSFCYHPLVLYVIVTVPLLIFCSLYSRKTKKMLSHRVWKNILFFGLGLLVFNFLIKNYLLLFRKLDVLALLDRIAA